ncbi:MAG: ABC transporter substrate binding protein [Rhodocyclaceae bacterium]|nr:ABC transporter substrate binding protein [Rhodocyclaceae bacterium]
MTSRRTLGRLLRLLLVLSALAVAWPAFSQVLLVVSDGNPAFDEAADAFRSELRRLAPRHMVTTVGLKDFGWPGEYQVVVTLGSQAARTVAALGTHPPAIHTLLPRNAFERMPGLKEGRDTAIFLDQPASRQVELVRQALPGFNRLAILGGKDLPELANQLTEAGRERKLTVMRENIGQESALYPALQRLLTEPAVLIATPDNSVFNSYSIQNVLLTAYRNRSPVLGFSSAYVRAGAILGLYSTPTQIGQQAAEIARGVLAGGPLPPPQAPRYFEVGTNPHVARSMGIPLDDPENLRGRLYRQEGLTP